MTGGEDIDPSYYGEEPNEKLETVNEVRDTSDSLLIKAALDEDIPMLCTCRGMQFLNVLSGGTLYQDLPTQNPSDIEHRDPDRKVFAKHEITVDKDNIVAAAFGGEGTYTVNSWHHQAVDQLGDNLKVVATAPDGIIEAIVREDKDYVMGLQFHPEAMIAEGDDSFLAFYTNLIDQAKEAE
jgi:putative glutamine amidotransferase